MGDANSVATGLGMLGQTLAMQGDYELAGGALREGLAISREVGDLWAVALLLNLLALVEVLPGHSTSARALCVEGLGIARELGDRFRVAELLMLMAQVSTLEGRHERAIRLAGCAAAVRETIAAPYSAFAAREYERRLAPAREALGPQACSAAWAAGKAMGVQEAIDYALASQEAGSEAAEARSLAQGNRLDTLSPREREIAMLLAEGLKNEEIAAKLVVSKRTVENHVSNILGKLGMASRSQVVAWVLEQGLPLPKSRGQNEVSHHIRPLIMLRPSRH
jgi:non-specific serine/threonine protein kinase